MSTTVERDPLIREGDELIAALKGSLLDLGTIRADYAEIDAGLVRLKKQDEEQQKKLEIIEAHLAEEAAAEKAAVIQEANPA